MVASGRPGAAGGLDLYAAHGCGANSDCDNAFVSIPGLNSAADDAYLTLPSSDPALFASTSH